MIRGIFLDFDGTIAESLKIHQDALEETLDHFKFKGDKKKLVSLLGIRLKIIFQILGIKIKDIDSFRDKYYEVLNDKTNNKTVNPCVNLKPLRKLSKNYPVFIISNSRTSYLKKTIKILKLVGMFKEVWGDDKGNNKEEMINKLLKKYKLKKSEIVYMGDSAVDIKVSKKVKCIGIAISNKYSWSSFNKLIKEKPDYIIKDFYGLEKIINKLNLS